jgi:hypothetical protein
MNAVRTALLTLHRMVAYLFATVGAITLSHISFLSRPLGTGQYLNIVIIKLFLPPNNLSSHHAGT